MTVRKVPCFGLRVLLLSIVAISVLLSHCEASTLNGKQINNNNNNNDKKVQPPPWQSRPLPASRDKIRSSILSRDKSQEDPFLQLASDEIRRDFLFDEDLTLRHRRAQSSETALPILIEVKLVGFDTGDDLVLQPKELQPFLDAVSDGGFFAVAPEAEHEREGKELSIRRRIVYSVSKAKRGLVDSITKVITDSTAAAFTQHDSDSGYVVANKVDEIIQTDYSTSSSTGYTIYILNPKTAEYVYSYQVDGAPFSHCTVNTFVSSNMRYVWVDVKADSATKQPGTLEEGATSVHDYPHWHRYNGIASSLRKEKLIVDVISFISRARDFIIAPSLSRLPFYHQSESVLVLDFIVIHDHPIASKEVADLFNATSIHSVISELAASTGHISSVRMKRTDLSLLDNPTIASVYKNSLRTYTSTMRNGVIAPHSHLYLDSTLLQYWLNHYKYNLGTYKSAVAGEKVIPIYVFDFNYFDILLLDNIRQAVSYRDMVIGVQIKGERAQYDFANCWCDEHPIHTDRTASSRPVLAALLQTIWGISETHKVWVGEKEGGYKTDLTWVMGDTPFGFFSKSPRSLSFSQKDAAARNSILSLIDAYLAVLREDIDSFSVFNHELYSVLTEAEYDQFVIRYNLFHLKLKEALNHLSFHEFTSSVRYLRSLRHEINVLSDIFHEATSRVHTRLICTDDAEASTFWWGVMIGPVTSVALVVAAIMIVKPKTHHHKEQKVKM